MKRVLTIAFAATSLGAAAPAFAQASDAQKLEWFANCDGIAESGVRLQCYDNAALRVRGVTPPPSTPPVGAGPYIAPAAPARAATATAPTAAAPAPGDTFGIDNVRREERPAKLSQPDEINAQVVSAHNNGIGYYTITLSTGAVWRMTEAAESSFRAPAKGDTVRIGKGALGGYMLYFGKQTPIRVTRDK